jgi:hypothetical protein
MCIVTSNVHGAKGGERPVKKAQFTSPSPHTLDNNIHSSPAIGTKIESMIHHSIPEQLVHMSKLSSKLGPCCQLQQYLLAFSLPWLLAKLASALRLLRPRIGLQKKSSIYRKSRLRALNTGLALCARQLITTSVVNWLGCTGLGLGSHWT